MTNRCGHCYDNEDRIRDSLTDEKKRTQSKTLPDDATRGHILFLFQFSKARTIRQNEQIRKAHHTLQDPQRIDWG
jgi:hypothetical protein